MVKQTLMPPLTEELISTIENNQSTVLFWDREDIARQILRNSSGQPERIEKALAKYPPIYVNDLVTHWSGRVTVDR